MYLIESERNERILFEYIREFLYAEKMRRERSVRECPSYIDFYICAKKNVSKNKPGGPIISTSHLKISLSSRSPAENPERETIKM